MGLFDKIKTLLYDVEEVEVEKKIPVEESKPTISTIVAEKEVPKAVGVQPDLKRAAPIPIIHSRQTPKIEAVEEKKESKIDDVVSERDLFKSESTFKFPVVFDEKDFKTDQNPYNRNNIVTTTNTKIRQQRLADNDKPVTPKVFKPSPIISPVYGILDKNYKKEDLSLVDETSYEVPRQKKVDFDTIRKKAYGTLTDDLEDTLIMNLKEDTAKRPIVESEEKDLIDLNVEEVNENKDSITVNELEELLEEDTKPSITIGEAHENYSDYGRAYNHEKPKEKEEIKEIEKEIKLEPIEPIDISDEEEISDKKLKREDKPNSKDLDLTDDLFNLINSMYDEE